MMASLLFHCNGKTCDNMYKNHRERLEALELAGFSPPRSKKVFPFYASKKGWYIFPSFVMAYSAQTIKKSKRPKH